MPLYQEKQRSVIYGEDGRLQLVDPKNIWVIKYKNHLWIWAGTAAFLHTRLYDDKSSNEVLKTRAFDAVQKRSMIQNASERAICGYSVVKYQKSGDLNVSFENFKSPLLKPVRALLARYSNFWERKHAAPAYLNLSLVSKAAGEICLYVCTLH